MIYTVFSKKARETKAQWAVRLYLDPWFEDATPDDVAYFSGLPVRKVRRVLAAWAKSARVRSIHSHAVCVSDSIGWTGTTEGLVHTALEIMAQRAQARDPVARTSLDDDIRRFLMEHSAPANFIPKRRTLLPPDTEGG